MSAVVTTERTKVRMLATVSGIGMPQYGMSRGEFSYAEGDTPDLHPALAVAWRNCGYAELPKEEKKASR